MNPGGIRVPAKVLLVTTPHSLVSALHHTLLLLPQGGHESETGQQLEEESQRDGNAAFGAA